MPDSYEAATHVAIAARQSSIASTQQHGRHTFHTIDVQAKFWAAEGYLDSLADFSFPVYTKNPRLIFSCNMKIGLELQLMQPTHAKLMQLFVEKINPDISKQPWQLVISVGTQGPTHYSLGVYKSLTLADLFKRMGVDILRERSKVSLTSYFFVEVKKPKGKGGRSVNTKKRSYDDLEEEFKFYSATSGPFKKKSSVKKEKIKKEVIGEVLLLWQR